MYFTLSSNRTTTVASKNCSKLGYYFETASLHKIIKLERYKKQKTVNSSKFNIAQGELSIARHSTLLQENHQ